MTIERTIVRRRREPESRSEPGITALHGTTLTVRDSVVEGSGYYGIGVGESTATIERSVVRDTRLVAEDPDRLGVGIFAVIDTARESEFPTSLSLNDSLVERNHRAGVLVWSASATVRRSIVRDTRGPEGRYGDGIAAALFDRSPPGFCGNGQLDWDEHCDGEALNNMTCQTLGYPGGTLGCNSSCKLDTTACTGTPGKEKQFGQRCNLEQSECRPGLLCVAPSSSSEEGFCTAVCGMDGRCPAAPGGAGCYVLPAGFVCMFGCQPGVLPCPPELICTEDGPLFFCTAEGPPAEPDWENPPDPSNPLRIVVQDSWVSANDRAGLLARDLGGAVNRSVFERGVFPIVLGGSSVDVGDDNLFVGNDDDGVYFDFGQQLQPPPMPVLPAPPN